MHRLPGVTATQMDEQLRQDTPEIAEVAHRKPREPHAEERSAPFPDERPRALGASGSRRLGDVGDNDPVPSGSYARSLGAEHFGANS